MCVDAEEERCRECGERARPEGVCDRADCDADSTAPQWDAADLDKPDEFHELGGEA